MRVRMSPVSSSARRGQTIPFDALTPEFLVSKNLLLARGYKCYTLLIPNENRAPMCVEVAMPSPRKIVTYRPGNQEETYLTRIIRERGISASLVIGQLIREETKRQGVTATPINEEAAKLARAKPGRD